MDTYVMIFLAIMILILLSLSIGSSCNPDSKTKEGFYTYYGYYKNYCPSN